MLRTAALAALLAWTAGWSRAEEAPPPAESRSATTAKAAVEELRGSLHRERMRIHWGDLADESPPVGTEVLIVQGYGGFVLTRLVRHADRIEAGAVLADRSWFYNEQGESHRAWTFDVEAERFDLAWNVMRRIHAASVERVVPIPEELKRRTSTGLGNHESADWIRVTLATAGPPVHLESRPHRARDGDDVPKWPGIRNRAVFDTFAALIPRDKALHRPADVAPWAALAAAELRAVPVPLDEDRFHRDDDLWVTCLRVVGAAGDADAEGAVAAYVRAIRSLPDGTPDIDEATIASERLRLRHRWSSDDAVRTLRELPGGTYAWSDHRKWLRASLRERDPAAWTAYLCEEFGRDGAHPDDVAVAEKEIRALPADAARRMLHDMIARDAPHGRVQAALLLRSLFPDDALGGKTLAEVALDRSIPFGLPADDRRSWSRNRALDAALAAGFVTRPALRAHVLDPAPDDPEFVRSAVRALSLTPDELSVAERLGLWRRMLDRAEPRVVRAAVEALLEHGDALSRLRMTYALERVAGSLGADETAALRKRIDTLGASDPADK